jgi:membrane-bound serine protease (ClpP class)
VRRPASDGRGSSSQIRRWRGATTKDSTREFEEEPTLPAANLAGETRATHLRDAAQVARRQTSARRSRVVVALLALVSGAAALVAPAAPAGAQGGCGAGDGPVSVVEVDGLIDPVLTRLVEDQIEDATDACALALVLQFDSGGVVIDDADLEDLVARIDGAELPVAVWVGPQGSRATGDAVDVLAAADVVGVPVGSTIEVTAELLDARGVDADAQGTVRVGDRIGAERAVELGLVDNDAPTILTFVAELEGFETEVVDGERRPVTQVTFSGLDILGELAHTVASPNVAYLLFTIGLALLLFEMFTAGVGIAGMVGAGALVLGCYGLGVLPTRPVGVVLLAFAFFGYAVDVQTGVPRVWTGIATLSFVAGSLLLFDGVSISWLTLLIVFVGVTLGMVAGMPTMVRSRFSTPTIGRDWMIGELGAARTDIDPDGIVTLRDAPWRARTNRATPIRKDEPARVVAIEGLVLEVEPEEGGARDYRERARSSE